MYSCWIIYLNMLRLVQNFYSNQMSTIYPRVPLRIIPFFCFGRLQRSIYALNIPYHTVCCALIYLILIFDCYLVVIRTSYKFYMSNKSCSLFISYLRFWIFSKNCQVRQSPYYVYYVIFTHWKLSVLFVVSREMQQIALLFQLYAVSFRWNN